MKCPNCGNEVPAGSQFCNHCGTKLSNEMPCPHCGNTIPSSSVFCPKCGKMVRNDMAQSGAAASGAGARAYDIGGNNTQRAAAQQRPAPNNIDFNDTQEAEEAPKSNFYRNLLLGGVAIVALIVLLSLMRNCSGGNDDNGGALTDSTQVVPTTVASQDPMVTFTDEVSRNNLNGDGAQAALAVRFEPEGEGDPTIAGITYLSSEDGKSFYRIYRLTPNGSVWDPEQLHVKYLNGRTLSFDNAMLMVDPMDMPKAVKLDNHNYLYYAYRSTPQGSGTTERVTLCLYDIDNKKLSELDYDGPVKTRTEDGRQYVYGQPLQSINNAQMRWLQKEARNIKLLYFPSKEELAADSARRAKAEEERQFAGEEKADAKWSHDNTEKMEALKGGEEVSMKAQTYEKPIFNIKEIDDKKENDRYIVFADKKGAVYGFNKDTRKYFVIYTPSSPTNTPTKIGFGGADNSEVRMRTPDGHISYNLAKDKAKTIEE